MDEIWKDIEGFEGLYAVSNLGRVKCLEHKCPGRYKGKPRTVKEHIMTQVCNKNNGYYYVTLSKLDRGRTFSVHRLVARAFLENPDNLPFVNHKDETRYNNRVDNLEWCTVLYNNTYNDVHKRKKKYIHRYEYDKDVLLKKANKFSNELKTFLDKYPESDVLTVVSELLSQ